MDKIGGYIAVVIFVLILVSFLNHPDSQKAQYDKKIQQYELCIHTVQNRIQVISSSINKANTSLQSAISNLDDIYPYDTYNIYSSIGNYSHAQDAQKNIRDAKEALSVNTSVYCDLPQN